MNPICGQTSWRGCFTAVALTISAAGMARAADESPFALRPLSLSTMQPVNPADAQGDAQREAEAQKQPVAPENPPTRRLRSSELPAITVVGENSALREEDRVGTYAQPRWTATRRFPNTRIYVIPENQIEVEYWIRPTFTREGETEIRSLYELEIGLPYRFQLDLYYRSDQVGTENYLNGAQFEIRWALADWGKIPGNPTIYLEYAPLEDRPDKIEGRLLFGDELAPRWHWGVNLNAELETGGEREYEYQISGGLSYTVADEKFSVGVEAKALFTDVHGNRGSFTDQYLIGPSIQFRPLSQLTINLAPLAGLGPNSPDAEITLNVGWEF